MASVRMYAPPETPSSPTSNNSGLLLRFKSKIKTQIASWDTRIHTESFEQNTVRQGFLLYSLNKRKRENVTSWFQEICIFSKLNCQIKVNRLQGGIHFFFFSAKARNVAEKYITLWCSTELHPKDNCGKDADKRQINEGAPIENGLDSIGIIGIVLLYRSHCRARHSHRHSWDTMYHKTGGNVNFVSRFQHKGSAWKKWHPIWQLMAPWASSTSEVKWLLNVYRWVTQY